LAAYGTRPADRDAGEMVRTNVDLTVRVIELTRAWQLSRFVYAGSISEYRPIPEPALLNEDSHIDSDTIYGATKAAGYLCGRAAALRNSVPFVSMRLFGMYGPGEAEHRLLPSLVRSLRKGERAALSQGEQKRDLCFIEDAVEGLALAASHPGVESGGVYNLCTGVGVEVREVARRVATAMGKPQALLGFGDLPYREGETMWLVGDPTRFETATGWRSRVALTEGIRQTIEQL
jgi:nucleoside-diphosphate-sugar epimerase